MKDSIQLAKDLISELENQQTHAKSKDELHFITKAKHQAITILTTLRYINQ